MSAGRFLNILLLLLLTHLPLFRQFYKVYLLLFYFSATAPLCSKIYFCVRAYFSKGNINVQSMMRVYVTMEGFYFFFGDGGGLVGWFCVCPTSRSEQKQSLSKLGVLYSFLEDSYLCRQAQCSMYLIYTKAKGKKGGLTWLV